MRQPQGQSAFYGSRAGYGTARNDTNYNCDETFETVNRFTPLRDRPESSLMRRFTACKHPASSPVDEDQTNKKQRENSTIREHGELTLSQNSAGQINPIDTENNNPNTNMDTQDTTQYNTSSGTVIRIQRPVNHKITRISPRQTTLTETFNGVARDI